MWHQWLNLNFMKLCEYFLCTKKTKIMTLFNNFFSSMSVFNTCSRYTTTRVVLLTKEPALWRTKLQLNHWCYMDYFNDVLTTFLGLERVSYIAVYAGSQKALGYHQKYLHLCSEDERRSNRFGTTWGWVINDNIFIWGELTLEVNGYFEWFLVKCLKQGQWPTQAQ